MAAAAAAVWEADEEDDQLCSEETLRLALNGYICADILVGSLLQQPITAHLVLHISTL